MNETLLETILRDADNVDERESIERTWERLETLDAVEPSRGFDRRFARTIEFTRAASARSWTRRLPGLAAALVAGVAIGLLALQPSDTGNARSVLPRADLDRLTRAVSAGFETRPTAARRLEAVESLSVLGGAGAGRALAGVVRTDPSIGVRLGAIDGLAAYLDDDETVRRLAAVLREVESPLVRIRLIELFVDHEVGAAIPEIEALNRDPRADALVRETAQWASGQL